MSHSIEMRDMQIPSTQDVLRDNQEENRSQLIRIVKKVAIFSLLTTTIVTPALVGTVGGYFLGGRYISYIAPEAGLGNLGIDYLTGLLTGLSGLIGGGVGFLLSRRIWHVFGRPS